MVKKITFCINIVLLLVHFSLSAFQFVSNKAQDGALSSSFLAEISSTFKSEIFIETGTCSGQTALNASQFFKHVHTVELSQVLYKECKKNVAIAQNVHLYCDQSPSFIKKVVPQCNGTIIFWLDAHYSGGNTVMSNENGNDCHAITAIREELATIAQSGVKDCVILIDDIRGFGSMINGIEYMGCWAYPTIQEIQGLGKKINPDFACALLGDILLMYDETKYAPTLSQIATACTKSRLYDGTNLTDQELLNNEHIIIQVTGDEKAFIKNLYDCMTPCKDPLFHHDLWYALSCMGSRDWKEAKDAIDLF